jgi:hypothetical protein
MGMNNNFFLSIPSSFRAWNSLTAGIKSARLAPVGWIIKLACLAISNVPWLVRAGASMTIKSYCLVSGHISFTELKT